jgi:hypothetical protein
LLFGRRQLGPRFVERFSMRLGEETPFAAAALDRGFYLSLGGVQLLGASSGFA